MRAHPASGAFPSAPSDPGLALRWLFRARRGALAIQVLLMVLAEAGTDLHLHSFALVALVALLVLVDLGEVAWLRRRSPPPWLVPAHGAVDLVMLTGILALSGGPRNPLIEAYLAYLALLAVVLPPRTAWSLTAMAIGLQALVVVQEGHLPGLESEVLPPGHLLGHIVAFDLSAVAITWVVSRLSLAYRQQEAAEREAQQRRATTERLAALGTLAAGVAHELGTPLATIQLLAEEAQEEAEDPAPMAAVLEQVDRCRSMLDRLRGTDDEAAGDCVPDVAGWVAEWQRVAPEVAVEVRLGLLPRVAGPEASWRGAVWVALDNARRAGARHVWVEESAADGIVEVRIADDGVGLDAEAAARVGEPFRTAWGGTGLGLFVSGAFARSVGGEVALTARPGGGALATLRMPRVTP